ncbi:MAG: YIP1 family protein [Candidatus Nanohalobium sp.]
MSGFWSKVSDVHFSPDKFFEEVKGDGVAEPAKFAAKMGLLFGGLLSLIAVLLGLTTHGVPPLSVFFIAVAALIVLPLFVLADTMFQAGLVHLAVLFLGEKDFNKTYNAVAYPTTAIMTWRWIPGINILAVPYNIYLQTKGLETLHEIKTGKALIAAIWPLIFWMAISSILIGGMAAASFVIGLEG